MRFRIVFKKNFHIILLCIFALAVILGGIYTISNSHNGVVINEVCASNVACCMDENGNYPDWIELYNTSSEPVDISGCIVNKSGDMNKEKYEIPAGTVLAPASFYLFDPHFTISSKGCIINLIDREKHYIDNVRIPGLRYDTCYARGGDGGYKWGVKTPTPGYSNSEGEDLDPVVESTVTPSDAPGFYDEEFDLKLSSAGFGKTILYTDDGTDPRVYGKPYSGSVRIRDRSNDPNVYSMIPETSLYYTENEVRLPSYPLDKCTVIRTVEKDLLGRYSEVSSFTYFVGYRNRSAYDDMPVVSVTVDPYDLFDHDEGIFVLGRDHDEYVDAGSPDDYEGSKANFSRTGRTSEREARIEIYDENHMPVLETKAGVRVKGLSSRWDVQKSMSFFFRKAYSGSNEQSFTVGATDFKVHSFALDKCGQDTGTKMVDAIMDKCMSTTRCATKKSTPCAVFLNGEYWGLYWLTERFDSQYFANRYGVNKDDIVIAESDKDFAETGWEIDVFDRESLLEYYAANIIVSHGGDWPQFNLRFWKTGSDEGTPYGDGKLRPVIFDMNSSSMKNTGEDVIEYLMTWYPFQNLSEDRKFREDLVKKIDHMSSDEFEQKKVLDLIEDINDRIRGQMIMDMMRYTDCSRDEAEETFDKNVDMLRDFYRNRYDYLKKYNEKYLNGDR